MRVTHQIMKGYQGMPADTWGEAETREKAEAEVIRLNGARSEDDLKLGVEYYVEPKKIVTVRPRKPPQQRVYFRR